MTRLALFDLDNTLIDRDAAFRSWAEEFVHGHSLGVEEVERLVALDEVVDAWAVSGAEGVRKPDRELFEIAATPRTPPATTGCGPATGIARRGVSRAAARAPSPGRAHR